MGALTFDQIITQGLKKVGNSSLTDEAAIDLKAWLRSQYEAFPFPGLKRKTAALALGAGITSLSLGAGSGGITLEIKRIFDPIWVYDVTYTTRVRARIRTLLGGSVDDDEYMNDPTKNVGTPQQFKVRASSALWGRWDLIPYPVPDRAYLLAIDYWVIPAAYTLGSEVASFYPNDRTLIQCVVAHGLDIEEGPSSAMAIAAHDKLRDMAVADYVKFGEVPGDNDKLRLDEEIFR